MRPSVVRVYPSGSPGYAPVVRPVDRQGAYGGFARLDPETGRVHRPDHRRRGARGPAGGWRSRRHGQARLPQARRPGRRLRPGHRRAGPGRGARGWSFCVTDPKPLPLRGQPRASTRSPPLCEYDLATGKRIAPRRRRRPGSPAAWTAGGSGVTRRARVHAVNDGTATAPGCTADGPPARPGPTGDRAPVRKTAILHRPGHERGAVPGRCGSLGGRDPPCRHRME